MLCMRSSLATKIALWSRPPSLEWRGAADYIDMQISSMRPCVYKIGITRDPHHRFYNDDHGYIHDGFTCMHLLIASSPYNCARLEEQLIGHFFEKPGCYNMAKGGRILLPRACLALPTLSLPRLTSVGASSIRGGVDHDVGLVVTEQYRKLH